jgi:hypothetical protein
MAHMRKLALLVLTAALLTGCGDDSSSTGATGSGPPKRSMPGAPDGKKKP